jgi:hypothetical protein
VTFFVYPWLSGIAGLQLIWAVSLAAFIAGNVLAGGASRG